LKDGEDTPINQNYLLTGKTHKMIRLGYTWYSQDYISDPDVMMMTPAQRGIYRDLIDLAYKEENKIVYSLSQLSKYTNGSEEEVLEVLNMKGKKEGDYWTIPSCENRIKKAEQNRINGQKGGRPKKPKNPEQNPSVLKTKTQSERQREREREREREIKEKRGSKVRPDDPDQICEYFKELGLNGISKSESEKFWDHYSSNGWKVGKNSMKDWKAACRNWKKNIDPSKYNHSGEKKMPWM
jgi:hypothetical protein